MDQEYYVSYIREEANHEIARLKTLLRDSRITAEDREIALAMLVFYEDARSVERSFSPELRDHLVLPPTKKSMAVLRESDQPPQADSPSGKKARAA